METTTHNDCVHSRLCYQFRGCLLEKEKEKEKEKSLVLDTQQLISYFSNQQSE